MYGTTWKPNNKIGFVLGVVVMALVTLTKLSYIESG